MSSDSEDELLMRAFTFRLAKLVCFSSEEVVTREKLELEPDFLRTGVSAALLDAWMVLVVVVVGTGNCCGAGTILILIVILEWPWANVLVWKTMRVLQSSLLHL